MRAMTQPRLALVFPALMLGLALAALDQTIVATALPTIAEDLGGFKAYSWVVTSYLLAVTVVTPLYGKLGDLFGRKLLFQIAVVLFLVGSVLCGLSGSMTELILFRAVQGVGGGGLVVGAQAITGDIIPARERPRYNGYFSAAFSLASVAGPLVGGLFVEKISWHWIFYINIPVGLLALAIIAVALPAPPHRTKVSIDYMGTMSLGVAVTCFILVTTWMGHESLLSPEILSLLFVGVAAVGLFVVVERRAAEPLVPLRLFRSSVVNVGIGLRFVVGFCIFAATTYVPKYLQIVQDVSPTMSGVHLVPMMAGMLATSIGSGHLVTRTGRYKRYTVVGMTLAVVSMALLTQLGRNTNGWLLSSYLLLLGAGLGMVAQITVVVVQNAVEARDLGAATSATSFTRTMGGSFGVALLGAVFNAVFSQRLTDSGVETSAKNVTLLENPDEISQLSSGDRSSVLDALVGGMDIAFLVAVPIVIVGVVLALRLRELPLATTAAATEGVSDSLGMHPTGSTAVVQEIAIRERAARESLVRLDRLASRTTVPDVWMTGLRHLMTGRLDYLSGATTRFGDEDAGDDVNPTFWEALDGLLRVERQSVAAGAGLERLPTGIEGVRFEAQVRIEAAKAALAQLDEWAAERRLPAEWKLLLEELFSRRVNFLETNVAQGLVVGEHAPAGFWAMVVDVLEAERVTLAADEAALEIDRSVAHRSLRDLHREARSLTGVH